MKCHFEALRVCVVKKFVKGSRQRRSLLHCQTNFSFGTEWREHSTSRSQPSASAHVYYKLDLVRWHDWTWWRLLSVFFSRSRYLNIHCNPLFLHFLCRFALLQRCVLMFWDLTYILNSNPIHTFHSNQGNSFNTFLALPLILSFPPHIAFNNPSSEKWQPLLLSLPRLTMITSS